MANSPLTELLNTYGQYLKPLTPFSQLTTLEDYLKPYNALYENYQSQFAAPEFQRQTFNPGMQGVADTAATTGGMMMGNNPATMQRQQRAFEIPYQEQLQQARNAIIGLGTTGYGQAYSDYMNNPNSFISGVTK